MYVILSGMVTSVKPKQQENASDPIFVTPSEIMTLLKPSHQINALFPIPDTAIPSISDGITTSVTSPLQPVISTVPSSSTVYFRSPYVPVSPASAAEADNTASGKASCICGKPTVHSTPAVAAATNFFHLLIAFSPFCLNQKLFI